MRKSLLFTLVGLLLPVLAVAQDNQAISKTHTNYTTSTSGRQERTLQIPYAAAVGHEMPSQVGDSYTIGMWFKQTERNSCTYTGVIKRSVLMGLATYEHMNLNGNWLLEITDEGKLYFDGHGGTDNGCGTYSMVGEVPNSPTIELDTWYYVTFVVDNINFKAALYLDGTLVNEWTTSSPGLFYGPTSNPWDDGLFRFIDYGFTGALDEINIYNRALEAEEVMVAKTNANAVSGMTGYYTLNTYDGIFANEATNAAENTNASYYLATGESFWKDSGLITMSYEPTEPTLVEGREIAPVEVEVTIEDVNGGTLTITDADGNTYELDTPNSILTGTTLNITATPEDGYQLIGIYAVDNMNNVTEITGDTYVVVKDVTITARFTNETYALTIQNDQEFPFTITLGGQEVTDYEHMLGGGAEYRLTVTVPDDKIFTSVTLNGVSQSPEEGGYYSIFLDGNATLAINGYAKEYFAVTFDTPANGTVSATANGKVLDSGESVLQGTTITLSNTPNEGYSFVSYLINGTTYSSSTYEVNSAVTISATFEEGIEHCAPAHKYGKTTSNRTTERYLTSSTVSDGTNSIEINSSNNGAFGYSYGRKMYDEDATILSITSEPGKTITITNVGAGVWMQNYAFFDADLNGLDENDKVLAIAGANSASYTGTRTFTIPDNILPGTHRVRYMITWMDVQPNPHENPSPCEFGQSGDNGDIVFDFDIVIPSQELENPRTVTVAVNDETLGTVAITNPATDESSVTSTQPIVIVKATANEGAAFINWTNAEGTVVSTDATYRYDGTDDVTLTANFGFAVNYSASGPGSIAVTNAEGTSVSNGSIVLPNTEITVVATPDAGKVLVNLSVNGTIVDSNETTVTVTEATTITATFSDAIYTLSLLTEGNGTMAVYNGLNDDTLGPDGTQFPDGSNITSDDELFVFLTPNEGEELERLIVTVGDEETDATQEALDFVNDDGQYIYILSYPEGNVTISAKFTTDSSAIDSVISDADANAPAEYYNLQGVKVGASNLAPGVYVVRQGSKTYKVLVK